MGCVISSPPFLLELHCEMLIGCTRDSVPIGVSPHFQCLQSSSSIFRASSSLITFGLQFVFWLFFFIFSNFQSLNQLCKSYVCNSLWLSSICFIPGAADVLTPSILILLEIGALGLLQLPSISRPTLWYFQAFSVFCRRDHLAYLASSQSPCH